MAIEIRQATVADAAHLVRLLDELGYPSGEEQVATRLQRMLQEPGQSVLVAEDDGRILGLVTLSLRHLITEDEPLARLSVLVVASDSRRRGVGRQLVAAAEKIAGQRGAYRIEVTSAERRADAHAFHASLGYEERRRRFVKVMTAG